MARLNCEFQNYPIQGLHTAIFNSQTILFEFVQVVLYRNRQFRYETEEKNNISSTNLPRRWFSLSERASFTSCDRKNGTCILKLDNNKKKSAHELFIDLPLNVSVKRQRAKVAHISPSPAINFVKCSDSCNCKCNFMRSNVANNKWKKNTNRKCSCSLFQCIWCMRHFFTCQQRAITLFLVFSLSLSFISLLLIFPLHRLQFVPWTKSLFSVLSDLVRNLIFEEINKSAKLLRATKSEQECTISWIHRCSIAHGCCMLGTKSELLSQP